MGEGRPGVPPIFLGVQEAAPPPEWVPPFSRDFKNPTDIRVQLREQHLYYRDNLLPVSRIIVHPEYYAIQAGFDIALLELEDPVNISCQVQPVTLPPTSETFPPGTPCWVTGWGNVDKGGKHQGKLEGLGEQGPVTPMTQLWSSLWGVGFPRAGSGSGSLASLGEGEAAEAGCIESTDLVPGQVT